MRRREFVAAGVAALAPTAILAQQRKMATVALLLGGTLAEFQIGVFRQALHDLGYVEGQSIRVEIHSAADDALRLPELAAALVRNKVDVIVPFGTNAALAAKHATSEIPIVLIALGDPVGTGLVDNLARPGGNVTGTSTMLSDLAAKRLALLKEAVPGISRVLVLSYLVDPIAPLQVKALQEASRSLSVALLVHEIRTADDIPVAFEAGARDRAEGLVITGESIFIAQRAQVSELAAHYRLPAIYPYSIQVTDGGGLMSYNVDYSEIQKSAATYVDKILKGAKPSDLPVQQPTKFSLVINLKTAKALGLTIPEPFLLRADQLIE